MSRSMVGILLLPLFVMACSNKSSSGVDGQPLAGFWLPKHQVLAARTQSAGKAVCSSAEDNILQVTNDGDFYWYNSDEKIQTDKIGRIDDQQKVGRYKVVQVGIELRLQRMSGSREETLIFLKATTAEVAARVEIDSTCYGSSNADDAAEKQKAAADAAEKQKTAAARDAKIQPFLSQIVGKTLVFHEDRFNESGYVVSIEKRQNDKKIMIVSIEVKANGLAILNLNDGTPEPGTYEVKSEDKGIFVAFIGKSVREGHYGYHSVIEGDLLKINSDKLTKIKGGDYVPEYQTIYKIK